MIYNKEFEKLYQKIIKNVNAKLFKYKQNKIKNKHLSIYY